MRSWVVPCHVPTILFLAGRLHCGGFQTLTDQILSLLFVSHLEVLSVLFFGQELTSDDFLLCFVTRCFFEELNDTNSDLLTRINMVKNGGFCRTERLLPHNVKCHMLRFFSL